MKIRRAVNEDAKAISKLIRSVAYSFTVNADGRGAEEFLEAIEPQAVRKYIESAEYKYFAGVIEDEIVGVAAIRQERHLFHLFVAEHHQHKGFARRLWEHVKNVAVATGKVQRITVNSTLVAVPVYERFGFNKIGDKVETKGIAYIPMSIDL